MKPRGIVAFAFGAPSNILSNWRIARIASQKARDFHAPVYTQMDVPLDHDVRLLGIKWTEEEPGSPPPTLRMARNAVRWATENGLKQLWIVAAKPHLPRCRRDLEAAVDEVGANIEVHVCPEIWSYPDDSWFCSESAQSRTRSERNWLRRERVLDVMPFSIYKHIAS